MSDLSSSRFFAKQAQINAHGNKTLQLLPHFYFDDVVFQAEQQLIFPKFPRYLGHTLAIPHAGDYATLIQEGNGRVLLRQADEANVLASEHIALLSNVCRHRQALILGDQQGQRYSRGNIQQSDGVNIICPLHRWTYDSCGKLLGAPHFSVQPELDLARFPLQNWNGLLFEQHPHTPSIASLLEQLGCLPMFNFQNFQFHSAHVHHCAYNWKTFIEVYLEDYHVVPFHPGLGGIVDCNALKWEFGEHYSVQTVGIQYDKLLTQGGTSTGRAGSAIYQIWHEAISQQFGHDLPKHGAVWLTLYPTLMLEYYPNTLVVSSLHALGPERTLNLVEFFYPEEICAFEPDFIAAQQAAYFETCTEDDAIAERMDCGRKALSARNVDEVGPYQSPMEDGMEHFHQWYRKLMQPSA